jgi:hypothetical protein
MITDREQRWARREAEWTRRDAEAEDRARVDARIDAAAAAAPSVLPGEVGEALAAMLEAMKPFRAADGHLSFSAVGRSSDEVVALAEAILRIRA